MSKTIATISRYSGMQISHFEGWSIILFRSGSKALCRLLLKVKAGTQPGGVQESRTGAVCCASHLRSTPMSWWRRSSSWRSAVMCRLCVRVLIWDYPMIFNTERELPPIYGLSWKPHRRVRVRYDNTHPVAGSHHQEVVARRVLWRSRSDLTSLGHLRSQAGRCETQGG